MPRHSPGSGPWGTLPLIPPNRTECSPRRAPVELCPRSQKQDRGLWSSAVWVQGQCGGGENRVGGLAQMGPWEGGSKR